MDIAAVLTIVLAAMTPVGELRLAIPLAMYHFHLPWFQALAWSWLGNMLPVPFLLVGLNLSGRLILSFNNPLGRLLTWRTNRLRSQQGERFRKYGSLALVIFVAIPLPLTGAWTGSLAAWAFDIPTRKALPLIALGVLGAGIIVTTLSQLGIAVPLLIKDIKG